MSTRGSKSKSKSKSASGAGIHGNYRAPKAQPMLQLANQVGAKDQYWPVAGNCVRAIFNETIRAHATSSGEYPPLNSGAGVGVSGVFTFGNDNGELRLSLFPVMDGDEGAGSMISALENTVHQSSSTASGSRIPGSVQLPGADFRFRIDAQESLDQPSNSKRTWDPTSDMIVPPKRTRPEHGKPAEQHGRDEEDDCEDGDGYDSTGKPADRERDEAIQSPLFACPYFRLDPVVHQGCLNYKLKRIRDVKQHLQRRHTLQPFYCPTCFKCFPSISCRDDHIRSRNCSTAQCHQTSNNIDGITGETQVRLSKKVNRAVKPEDQWYAVWEILFGGSLKKPADGPFIGSMVRETFRMVRAFWRLNGSEILPRFLKSQAKHIKDTGTFEELLFGMFHEVEAQFESSLDIQTTGSPCTSRTSVQNPCEQVATCKFEPFTEGGQGYPTPVASNNGTPLSFASTHPFNMVGALVWHHSIDPTETALVSDLGGALPPSEFGGEVEEYDADAPFNFHFDNWTGRGVGSCENPVLTPSSFTEPDLVQQSSDFHYAHQFEIGQPLNLQQLDFDGMPVTWQSMPYVTS